MTQLNRTRLNVECLDDRCTPANLYTVNNASDTVIAGQMNLRQAITEANNNVGRYIITFAGNVNLIELSTALPAITEGVIVNQSQPQPGVQGDAETPAIPASHLVTIKRAVNASNFRILTIDIAANQNDRVDLKLLTMTGGYSTSNGGGILSRNATVTMFGCSVTNNTAAVDGGGIWTTDDVNFVTLTKYNDIISRVADNTASNGGGVALYNTEFRLFDNSEIVNNQAVLSGGGIYAQTNNDVALNHIIEIKQGKVDNNTANHGDGGGIYAENLGGQRAAEIILREGSINGNQAKRTIVNSELISGGNGGAIATKLNVTIWHDVLSAFEVKDNSQHAHFLNTDLPCIYYTIPFSVSMINVVFTNNNMIPLQ
jgi:predicted outer membrane repeat protein